MLSYISLAFEHISHVIISHVWLMFKSINLISCLSHSWLMFDQISSFTPLISSEVWLTFDWPHISQIWLVDLTLHLIGLFDFISHFTSSLFSLTIDSISHLTDPFKLISRLNYFLNKNKIPCLYNKRSHKFDYHFVHILADQKYVFFTWNKAEANLKTPPINNEEYSFEIINAYGNNLLIFSDCHLVLLSQHTVMCTN